MRRPVHGRVARPCAALALWLAALALLAAPAPAVGPEGVLDGRAWEMVSPVEKNGGEVTPVGAGVLAAAAQGGAAAFASAASFGEAAGAAPVSQYVATRGGGGWSTANVTPPLLSGTYDGDPYLLFSADLARALVSGGWACRDGGEACEAENPPLGLGGPAGYRNLYLQEGSANTPLVTEANFPALPAEPEDFHLALEGASPDLGHIVFESDTQLYEWNEGTIVAIGPPGASLAASGNERGAVSADGARVYFAEAGGLYLREGKTTKMLAAGATFGAATPDGATAFFTKGEQLFSYDAAAGTQSGALASGVKAVLGTSPDGANVFYVASGGIYRRHAGASTKIVPAANLSHLPPATGPAAIAAGGDRLFFTSSDALLPLRDSNGQPDAYEWEAQGTGSCASAPGCLGLLSSGRSGSATFAGASASGEDAYFLTAVSLLPADTGALDLYDARAGGGFPEPAPVTPCLGDDCQGPPPGPDDPVPSTEVVSGPANPPVRFAGPRCPKKAKRARHRKPRCGPGRHHRKHGHSHGSGR